MSTFEQVMEERRAEVIKTLMPLGNKERLDFVLKADDWFSYKGDKEPETYSAADVAKYLMGFDPIMGEGGVIIFLLENELIVDRDEEDRDQE